MLGKTLAVALPLLLAHWRPEYAQLPQEVQDWYLNAQVTPQAQIRLGFRSCCAHSDVVHTKFKVNKVDGQDEWYYQWGNEWLRVPPDIVETGKSAPDGQPTLFMTGPIPTCFFPGDGGI